MTPDCSHCLKLQRQVTDLLAEVAAWRAGDRAGVDRSIVLARQDRWSAHLGLSPGATRMLLALVDASPGGLTLDSLAQSSRPQRDVGELENVLDLVRTYVWQIRTGLKARGIVLRIRPIRGLGYIADAVEARALVASIEGPR